VRWSVFARVIDNWGDVGFAWRLARALQARGERVRLVVDDASALAWMAPERGREPRVEAWPGDAAAVSDVAVETFGCGLPAGVRADVFVNVEHLTAEPFAALSHGLPSPSGGRTTWFYYPGFDPGTGGLLGPPIAPSEPPAERTVTAFGYPNAAWPALLERLAEDGAPTRILALPGGATEALRLAFGPSLARAALRVEPIGFASQEGYDRLLAGATLNLVRGEDSLVRALRAGRPFLWQAYVQDDGAHVAKVRAFAERYARDAPEPLGAALRGAFAAWNGFAPPGAPFAWPDPGAWARHARAFADALAVQPDLAERLVEFARLKWRALRRSDASTRVTP
jgi:hypothetical protein